MSKRSPWAEIGTPTDGMNVLLVGRSAAVGINWGKNAKQQCLLVIELNGDHRAQYQREIISVRGIETDFRQSDRGGSQNLIFSLEKDVDQDLFLGLCETLIAALDGVEDPAAALGICLIQLKRWKMFLSGKNPRLLSNEEVRGLFAELRFLEALMSNLGAPEAIEAWCGPDRIQQDFIFGDQAVEIKAVSGRERNSVRISSEDQLETMTRRLFLRVYRLATGKDSKGSESLNALVTRLSATVTDTVALQSLEKSLANYGYLKLDAYDLPRLTVADEATYTVIEGFPRLVRSKLPAGVARVSYDIELETIKPFICSPTEIMSEI